MELKIKLSATLNNGKISVKVRDLDNEGKTADVDIFISGKGFLKTKTIDSLGGEEQIIEFEDTPKTGKTHNVRATIASSGINIASDADNKLIELPM